MLLIGKEVMNGFAMQKKSIQIGTTYIVKVSGKLARVRITGQSPHGGWSGTNLATGREIRIRTAARLRSEAKPVQRISPDEARKIVDRIKF